MHPAFDAKLPAGGHLVAFPDTPLLLLLSLKVALRVELLQQRGWRAGNFTSLHTAQHCDQGSPTIVQALVLEDAHVRGSAADTGRFARDMPPTHTHLLLEGPRVLLMQRQGMPSAACQCLCRQGSHRSQLKGLPLRPSSSLPWAAAVCWAVPQAAALPGLQATAREGAAAGPTCWGHPRPSQWYPSCRAAEMYGRKAHRHLVQSMVSQLQGSKDFWHEVSQHLVQSMVSQLQGSKDVWHESS